MVRDEGVGAEGSHKAFKASDISTTRRKDQTRVEELAVKLLCFLEVVGRVRQPFFDGRAIFGFFGTSDGDSAFQKVPFETEVGDN